MGGYIVDAIATEEIFDETGYLAANPDISKAVADGSLPSGRVHFENFGRHEKRPQRHVKKISEVKKDKLARIRPLLRKDMRMVESDECLDFLTAELRTQFNIIDTDAVSSNVYDMHSVALIEKHRDGIILDCGAGKRGVYYDNVVNFEIVAYDTTDVRGVGEVLPFKDNSFDAVFSLAVLEHVKDPFQCAKEIIRVLKPGGDLMCCVPFLQPMHGYPHHYYNMTEQGIRNLFEPHIAIDRHEVYGTVRPIASLTWILNSWKDGLHGAAQDEFLNLTVSDLLGAPDDYKNREFVKQLSREKNFELASATVIFGKKEHEAPASRPQRRMPIGRLVSRLFSGASFSALRKR